jgi:predicted DNA-binding protein
MPTSVRLDPETESLLKRLARSSGRTKSEIIREALQQMAGGPGEAADAESLYHAVEDLVGIAEDGPEDLAVEHKAHFRDKLRRRT